MGSCQGIANSDLLDVWDGLPLKYRHRYGDMRTGVLAASGKSSAGPGPAQHWHARQCLSLRSEARIAGTGAMCQPIDR